MSRRASAEHLLKTQYSLTMTLWRMFPKIAGPFLRGLTRTRPLMSLVSGFTPTNPPTIFVVARDPVLRPQALEAIRSPINWHHSYAANETDKYLGVSPGNGRGEHHLKTEKEISRDVSFLCIGCSIYMTSMLPFCINVITYLWLFCTLN